MFMEVGFLLSFTVRNSFWECVNGSPSMVSLACKILLGFTNLNDLSLSSRPKFLPFKGLHITPHRATSLNDLLNCPYDLSRGFVIPDHEPTNVLEIFKIDRHFFFWVTERPRNLRSSLLNEHLQKALPKRPSPRSRRSNQKQRPIQ